MFAILLNFNFALSSNVHTIHRMQCVCVPVACERGRTFVCLCFCMDIWLQPKQWNVFDFLYSHRISIAIAITITDTIYMEKILWSDELHQNDTYNYILYHTPHIINRFCTLSEYFMHSILLFIFLSLQPYSHFHSYFPNRAKTH